jgi:hypothetical protein
MSCLFLTTATPEAGKTTFAVEAARRWRNKVSPIVVVVPTSHLRVQWAKVANKFGINLDPTFTNSMATLARDYDGAVVTYQTVASAPHIFRRLADKAFVILDEVHHAGEQRSWDDALRTAFDPAARRLLLSGTPFRSDNYPIPHPLRAGRRRNPTQPLQLQLLLRSGRRRRRGAPHRVPGVRRRRHVTRRRHLGHWQTHQRRRGRSQEGTAGRAQARR